MTAIEARIAALQQQVKANTTVIGSASTLIRGFAQELADAIAAAKAEGATAAQLQQLDALSAELKQSDDDLAAAVLEGTAGTGSGQVEP